MITPNTFCLRIICSTFGKPKKLFYSVNFITNLPLLGILMCNQIFNYWFAHYIVAEVELLMRFLENLMCHHFSARGPNTALQVWGCNVRVYVKIEKLLNPKNRWLIDLVFNYYKTSVRFQKFFFHIYYYFYIYCRLY